MRSKAHGYAVGGREKTEICHSFELYAETMDIFFEAFRNTPPVNIVLTGFLQEHIDAILPYIKSTVRSLYLFKCPKLTDFDFLAECKHPESVEIYWNQKATALWNVQETPKLHTLIVDSCNKLHTLADLAGSSIRHLEIWGCNRITSFMPKNHIPDLSVLQTMPRPEHLEL